MEDFCFKCSYVSFMDCFHKQISGFPMGALCSCLFVILAMHFILSEVERELDFTFLILPVYVDDIFAIIPRESVLSIFNSIVPEIKFIYELKNLNQSKSILRWIFRNPLDGKLSTDLYRKPRNNNRTINFNTLHPSHQKMNIFTESKLRIINLCSVEFRKKNFIKLKEDSCKNCYVARLIYLVLNSHTNTPSLEVPTELANMRYFKLFSIPGLSNQLKSVLNKESVKIIHYSKNTLNSLV